MANTSDHTGGSGVDTTTTQIEFLKLLKIYRAANHQLPVSTAKKDIDWDSVVPAEAIGEIYTSLTVTPSPVGGRMVRLNGRVDIDGQSLQLISDNQRDALIHALENPDSEESAAIFQVLGSSPQLRLRYPENAEAGRDFVANQIASLGDLDDQEELEAVFTDLVASATQAEMFRLYDLANGHDRGTGGDPTRRARSMEFALRMKPASLPELVCYFEFYNASCEVAAMSAAKAEVERRSAAGEKIGRGTQKKIRKEKRALVALQDSSTTGNLGEGIFEDIENTINNYKSAVADLEFGVGPISCPYVEGDFPVNCMEIKARHATLKFGDLASAAYHTMKHFGELRTAARVISTDRTDVENQVFSYYTAARAEVNVTATSTVQIGQSGGEKHVFKTNNMRAITWLNKGQTGLATFTS